MKTEITRIKLKLKGRDIELTAQEAREVQAELNKLFELEKTQLQKIQDGLDKLASKEYIPYPVYTTPIIIDRPTIPQWSPTWTVWSSADKGVAGDSPGTLCMSVGQTT